MTSTEDSPPSVEEQYLSAGHSSNLRVEADRRSDADVLIAMGWSATRLGGALLRLHGEWDGAEKRPRMSETDLLLLRGKLKSLSSVLVQVCDAMAKLGMADPEARAGAIVGYWLYQVCHTCHGLKFERVRNTPVLSATRCKSCQGSGLAWVPHGADGRRMLNLMDDSVAVARASASRRLRKLMNRA